MTDIALLIAVIVALVELFKRIGAPKKYLPLISLAIGLVAGVFYLEGTIQEQVLYGVIIGLSASGLFDQSKIVTKKGEGK